MRGDLPSWSGFSDLAGTSPPRARGSTCKTPFAYPFKHVSPACAGIYLPPASASSFPSCLPRVRGDLPGEEVLQTSSGGSPPRARGSTSTKLPCACRGNVSPACAGIYLAYVFETVPVPGLPRVRGDLPLWNCLSRALLESPPRARGSTQTTGGRLGAYYVSPACAGIYQKLTSGVDKCTCLPRVRGDLPYGLTVSGIGAKSPPRARGSTSGR